MMNITRESTMGIGWTELLVVFCVVLLFFGAKRIPEVARALGKASREFKKARDSVVDEVRDSVDEQKKETDEEKKAGQQDGKKQPSPEKQLPDYDKKDE